jgi:4-amino-4-deoxy-L-arabinose transferase-like glycosyltransferase
MKTSNQTWIRPDSTTFERTDWMALLSILAAGTLLRCFLYAGYFGSDEVTYVEIAANMAAGDWRAPSYIGATRYGMNLPVALSIYLFGLSEASANLWPLICSIGEVALVYAMARCFWNTRAAVISAGLLALLPLHVHFAGRIMADPPLAFFLTLSVALMLLAVRSRSAFTYVLAGLAWGGVYWVKESVAILYLPVFLFLTLYRCRLAGPWVWVLAGAAAGVLSNCVFMFFLADDPLHLFKVMGKTIGGFSDMVVRTSPWYYFHYLFIDIRHTLFIGVLALAGCFKFGWTALRRKHADDNTQFVVVWALLMVGMFSFAILSFDPVKFLLKQTNYMLIFMGPLALIGGWYLASLSNRILAPVSALIVVGSVTLAALEQQSIAVFTANSRAAYVYLRDHPSTFLIASTNNERAINFYSMIDEAPEMRDRIMPLSNLGHPANSDTQLTHRAEGKDIVALLDLQNVHWGTKPSPIRSLGGVPPCWQPMGIIEPAPLGLGQWIAESLIAMAHWLPQELRMHLDPTLQSISRPAAGHLFRVDASCFDKALR